MEPEGSLPHSQVPATCRYPEPALCVCVRVCVCIYSSMVQRPLVDHGLLIIKALRSHSSGLVISPTQRPLPDNTRHS